MSTVFADIVFADILCTPYNLCIIHMYITGRLEVDFWLYEILIASSIFT